jgi:crossover junction endodeoxyribonuclease RusA
MTAILIPLPWPKPPLTGNRTRGNPYARAQEVKVAKDQAIVAVARVARRPLEGAEVTLHFRPVNKQRRDADGLTPTLKVCLDALVVQGVLPDDSWSYVPAVTCRIHTPTGEPAQMWLELIPKPDCAEAAHDALAEQQRRLGVSA